MKNEQDITKLPRWAQSRIQVAEMRLKEAQTRIDQINGMADTDTFIAEYPDMRPLPKDSNIRFMLDKRKWINVRIRAGRVLVMGSYAIDLRPESANTLSVGVMD
jgi:hypothetical protein